MPSVVEPERKIPLVDGVDVLVAGGGIAGIFAAIVAARQGAATFGALNRRTWR